MVDGYLDFSTDLVESACKKTLDRIYRYRRRTRANYIRDYEQGACRVWSWMGFNMRRWAIQSYYDNSKHLEFLLQETLCKRLLSAARLHRLSVGENATSKMFLTADTAERINLGDAL